jgi:hypothetical protein
VVVGSTTGGQTASVLHLAVATGMHRGIDPFASLQEARPGLLALAEKPIREPLLDWRTDRWQLSQTRGQPFGRRDWPFPLYAVPCRRHRLSQRASVLVPPVARPRWLIWRRVGGVL